MGFRGDQRGQAEVIGALLIFAVIVAFIGLNQAFLVPQANEDVEFKHNNDVQRDIVDLRSGISEAAASNEPRSRSIALGTDYPPRFVAINPPPASGTLRTVDGGTITTNARTNLSTVCGTSGEPDTKFLEYKPNYNEYQSALPVNVENNVVYRQGSGNAVFNTGQLLVQGNQINVVRVVGDVRETNSGTISVDLIPSETGRQIVETPPEGSNDNLNITIPSRVGAAEWNQMLPGGVKTTENGDNVTIRLGEPSENNQYVIRCTSVGINEAPDVNPTSVNVDDGNTSNDPGLFNPLTGLRFINATTGTNDKSVDVRLLNNRNETVEIKRMRILHYGPGGQGQGEGGTPNPEIVTYNGKTLEIGGSAKAVNSPEIDSNETVTLTQEFDTEDGDFKGHTEGAWYVMYLEYTGNQTGERYSGDYFVPIKIE